MASKNEINKVAADAAGMESKKKLSKKKKRLILMITAVVILIGAACYTVFIQPLLEKEEVVYEEGKVHQGTFTVKVVESGSLEYTIENITYDIDVNVTDEDDDEDEEDEEELVQKYLEIEEIYVAAGSPVTEGEALLKFSDSSVEAVRKLLQSALVSAEADYNEAESEYKLAVLEAESSYEIQKINGKYASVIYTSGKSQIDNDITSMELEIQSLSSKTSSLQEAVEEAQETYKEAKENYDTIYNDYMAYYNNTDNLPSTISAQNTYLNVKNTYERAKSALAQAEQNLESNAEKIEQLKQDIVLAKAQSVISKLEAEQTYSENKMNADNADYSLNAALESLIEDLEEAEEEKKTLEQKLADFEELVGEEGIVYAEKTGLITAVSYYAGDTLERVGNLFSYATEDTMHITVDVTQEDIITLAVGDEVSIDFSAYEEPFTGYIESINTTATSAETPTVSYQVVILVVGSLDQLFDGMSANVSFVTAEKENAVFVERKAIVEENGKEYVYVKDGMVGKTLTEVETGLRNENYVEIVSGLTAENTIYVPVVE